MMYRKRVSFLVSRDSLKLKQRSRVQRWVRTEVRTEEKSRETKTGLNDLKYEMVVIVIEEREGVGVM